MKKVFVFATALVFGMSLAFAQEPVKKDVQKEPVKAEAACPQAAQHKCHKACPHAAKQVNPNAAKAEQPKVCDQKQCDHKTMKQPEKKLAPVKNEKKEQTVKAPATLKK